MRSRQINPNFFNNEKPKSVVSLKTKFKAARADGTLNLSSSKPPLTDLPLEIFELENHIEEGEKFWELVPLATLDISFNKVSTIPPNVGQLADCSTFKFRNNLIASLPNTLYGGCVNLKHLDVDSNGLEEISDLIGQLPQLKDLILSNNSIRSLPLSLFEVSSLRHLDLQGNQIQSLPEGQWAIENLVFLNIANNKIQRLPSFISGMRSLETLFCQSNSIQSLPDLSQLSSLKFLNASQNALSEFPRLALVVKGKSKLVELHVGYNRIHSIDLNGLLAQSSSLCEFLIHNNQLSEVPDELEMLTELKILDISNNSLKEIPPTLGWMANLQRLKADGNPLKSIRQLLLTKPANELKAYLRTRGPSMLTPASGSASHAAYDDGKGASLEDQVQSRIREISSSTLDLTNMQLRELPRRFLNDLVEVPAYSTLTTVNLSSNLFTVVPHQLEQLSMVKVLQMHNNKLGSNRQPQRCAEEECQYLEGVVSLDVSKNELTPLHLEALLAKVQRERLVELIADCNDLPFVVQSVNELQNLKVLRLSYCKLTTLDGIIFSMLPRLESLDVSSNKLCDLSVSLVTEALSLDYLNIENNCLQDIPPEVSLLPRLKVLLIVGNPQRGIRTHIIQQGSEAILASLRKKLQDETGEVPTLKPRNPTAAGVKATVFKNQNEWNSDSSSSMERINQTRNAYQEGTQQVRSGGGSKPLISYVQRDSSGFDNDRSSAVDGGAGNRQQRSQALKNVNAKKQAFVNNSEWNF